MPESILSEPTIHLFGTAITDLTLDTTAYGRGVVAKALKEAAEATEEDAKCSAEKLAEEAKADARAIADAKAKAGEEVRGKPTIARIYAFAFQNEFFDLVSPALFVVPGAGQSVKDNLDLTGLARIPDKLNPTLTVWKVERQDITLRLDIMTGTFDSVLLDYELAESGLQDFVRGGSQLGTPTAISSRNRRPRGWRSDDE